MSLQQAGGGSLGIGLSGINDYSTEVPFLDAFRSARAWIPQTSSQWDSGQKLDLDANGWVKSLPTNGFAGTLLLLGTQGVSPSGRYVVTYEGQGTIEYGLDSSKIATDSRAGRDVINFNNAGGGIHLKITATDPNNYIRNIRVYHEADLPLVQQGQMFNPTLVDRVNEFGTLRFMDWMGTNGSEQQNWSERPTLNTASWATKGAPVEAMVALANQTNTSPWFNMPVKATDEYMRNFAAYVRDNLNPGLKAHVEFSNEVWNWQFPQAQYALQQAKNRWGDVEGGWMQWYGMRTAQMAEIWKSTFGDQSDRVVAVISSQGAYKGLENYLLNAPAYVAEGNEAPWKSVDAYSIAAYFGYSMGLPENAPTVRSWLSDADGGFGKAFQQLRYGGLLPYDGDDSVAEDIDMFNYQANVARQRGLKLMAYEGGQHLVGVGNEVNSEVLTNFFIALNKRPEMYDLYKQHLQNWKQAGGTLFNAFSSVGKGSKWGSWGVLDDINQTRSPKFDALIDFMNSTPVWWSGGSAPAPAPAPSPTPSPMPTPASVPSPTPIVGDGDGLTGQYYNNRDFTDLKVTRVDPTVNFDWQQGAPATSMEADTFSVRWSGKVLAPVSGTYTFSGTTDDGMRLWVNGQQIINNFRDQAATEAKGTIALVAGQKYDIKMEYYENGGAASARLAWSAPGLAQQVIPKSYLFSNAAAIPTPSLPSTPPPPPTTATGQGLQGQYFNNHDFTDLKLTRVDPTVNFDWKTNAPAAGVDYDTFSVRWSGQVLPPVSGTYTFYTNTDDGVRLWVNGQQVINSFRNQAATEVTGTIALKAGQKYDIKMEYYDNTWNASASLAWSAPGVVKQIIPKDNLFSSSASLSRRSQRSVDSLTGKANHEALTGNSDLLTARRTHKRTLTADRTLSSKASKVKAIDQADFSTLISGADTQLTQIDRHAIGGMDILFNQQGTSLAGVKTGLNLAASNKAI